MKKRIVLAVLLLVCVMFLFTGCVPGGDSSDPGNPAGFFRGVWHGWIAPVSLIMSIFNDQYSIYEVHNNGLRYELGFYIAIISGFGGITFIRRRRD